METLTIRVKNKKGRELIRELESQHLIEVISQPASNARSKKYAGKLPAEVAEDLLNYVTKSRGEWDK